MSRVRDDNPKNMKVDALNPFHYKTFNLEELKNYFHQKPSSIKVQLVRLCKNKKLIRLKQNLYTFPDFHPGVFLIGQQMVAPSYYSLESVLSWNGIIPEGVATYTLITSKKTQKYSNEFGTFGYRHLSPELFFGVEHRKDGVWLATREKALLDYLYLNSKKFTAKSYPKGATFFPCWEAERFDGLSDLNWKQMQKWALKYKMKKLKILVDSLGSYVGSSEYQGHK